VLCDGHGCRRRDSPHALNIDLTGGRLVFLAKDFEPSNSLEKKFKAVARVFSFSAGICTIRPLTSCPIKCYLGKINDEMDATQYSPFPKSTTIASVSNSLIFSRSEALRNGT
jgi:hypothetical protein